MEAEPTCGKGLAENAVLPENLAAVAEAMAAVLEVHQKSLDLTDPRTRVEFEAYQKVAEDLRGGGWHFKEAAKRMMASRQMPMGKHRVEALASPEAGAVFATFVMAERELLSLLHAGVERDQRMLAEMHGPGPA